MKQKLLRYSFLAGVVLAIGSPTIASAKTLSEAIEHSWKQHPAIAVAQAGSDYAGREVKEERSGFYPTINVTASTGRQFADNSTSRGLSVTRGAGYSNFWDGTVSLRQGIFDGGSHRSKFNAAKTRGDSAEAIISITKDSLANAVSSSYIEILRVYRGLSMIDAHRGQMVDHLARIQGAVQDGAADDNEYNQALDLSLSLEALLSTYENQLLNAQAAYREVVGEEPQGEISTPIVDPHLIPVSAEAAIDLAKSQNANLQRAVLDAEAAAYEVDTERAAYYPNVDGELSYLKSEKRDLIGGEAEDARAFLRVNWNFETGGAVDHRINKRKFRYEENLARVDEIEKQIERDIHISFADYQGAVTQLNLLGQRLQISRNLLATYEEQFEGARASLLQLMQARHQAFLIELDEMSAQHGVLNAQYGILSAMGAMQSIVRSAPAVTAYNGAE